MTTGLFRWPIDVLLRPEALVAARSDEETTGVLAAIATSVKVSIVYFANLLLYALPLTYAGIGTGEASTAPEGIRSLVGPFVTDPDAFWQFSVALVRNSSFLFVATILTFGTFHLGVVLTRSSDGIVRSLRTVSYSTGIYLATMFTVVWYAATAPSVRVADDLLVSLQASFFYFFIDRSGANLDLPGGRPDSVDPGLMTTVDQLLLTALLLSAVYYLYVLYVGARVSHRCTRFEALVAVAFVTVSPALYAIGVIASSTLFL